MMVVKIMMETPLGNSVRQAIETSDEEKVSPRGHHFSVLVQPTNQGVASETCPGACSLPTPLQVLVFQGGLLPVCFSKN